MTDQAPRRPQPKIDTTTAHTARIWNYWLGGKDNYPVDRQVGDQIRQLHPGIGDYARADRLFLGRAVQYLAGEAGIRQFLDIGTGLDAVPAGSYLALSHTITSPAMPDVDAAVAFWNEHGTPKLTSGHPSRSPASSTGLSCWRPGWCRVPGGVPRQRRRASPPRWPCTAESRASPDRRAAARLGWWCDGRAQGRGRGGRGRA